MSSSYRRNSYRENNQATNESNLSVPYREAHPDSGEVPLYDIDQFIVPGRDEHGGHQTVVFNCPPLLVHQVLVAVRTNLFPYINLEALVRHAVVRHLRWLQSIRPESMDQHMAPAIEAILERCFESQMQRKVKAAFDALRETTLQCERDGEHMEVLRLVHYVKMRLKSVGEKSIWQRRAWQKFLDEFNLYLMIPEGTVLPEGKGIALPGTLAKLKKLGTVSNEMEDAVEGDGEDDGGELVN
jgi:hypothetical protein